VHVFIIGGKLRLNTGPPTIFTINRLHGMRQVYIAADRLPPALCLADNFLCESAIARDDNAVIIDSRGNKLFGHFGYNP